MQNSRDRFSVFVRLALAAIVLVVAAIVVQNVWQRIMAPEERSLNDAAREYKGVKKVSFLDSPYESKY